MPRKNASAPRFRVSGPLLDRIDTHVEVPALRYQELASRDPGEPSAAIRQRVNAPAPSSLTAFKREGQLGSGLTIDSAEKPPIHENLGHQK
jgi:predicted ATPase with chaperone activity